MLTNIARSLPRAYRFRPVGDLATEIEWAKNRRLAPSDYAEAVGDRRTPIPVDLMTRVYRHYEQRKAAQGKVDFEDVLELTIRMYEDDPHALAAFRERIRAVTVDEFQDVNLLQWTLLGLWLGERDDVCVVGDDHQAIYSFTGATPRYLLDLPKVYPSATIVRLEENYRSTPQILGLANRLVPALGGAEKRLRAVLPDGPEPEALALDGPQETRWSSTGSARCSRRASRRERSRSSTARTRARPGTSRRWPRRGSPSRCATAGSSRARRRAACARSSAARARRSSRSR